MCFSAGTSPPRANAQLGDPVNEVRDTRSRLLSPLLAVVVERAFCPSDLPPANSPSPSSLTASKYLTYAAARSFILNENAFSNAEVIYKWRQRGKDKKDATNFGYTTLLPDKIPQSTNI